MTEDLLKRILKLEDRIDELSVKKSVSDDGTIIYRHIHSDLIHRDGGLPAVEYAHGSKEWRVNEQRHRDGGLPAIEKENGDKEWWVNGKQYRVGGLPATERVDGKVIKISYMKRFLNIFT